MSPLPLGIVAASGTEIAPLIVDYLVVAGGGGGNCKKIMTPHIFKFLSHSRCTLNSLKPFIP